VLILRQRTTVVLALVLVAVAVASGLVLTRTIQPTPPPQTIYWMYSAKFICSMNNNYTHPNPNGVAPGTYETDINIHNHYQYPFPYPSSVNITKYVVVALAENLPTTPPVPLGTGHETLFESRAFRVDCVEILNTLRAQCPNLSAQPYCLWVLPINPHSPLTYAGPVTGFVEFIVKTSGTPTAPPPPLDVVAVYTTAPFNCTQVLDRSTTPPTIYTFCQPGNATTLEVVEVPYKQSFP
jgi:hypothetical protein